MDIFLQALNIFPSGVDVHVVEASGGMTGTSKEIEAVPDDGPGTRLTRLQAGKIQVVNTPLFFFLITKIAIVEDL